MDAPPNRRKGLAIGAGLVALTLLAYARVGANGFIDLDDNDYVTENLQVQAGLSWSGVAWAFTTGRSANWHPLTWLSHMLDCQLFGLDPVGHHLVSLLLHLASTLALYQLFRRMTAALWPSAFVAAVFALHPLHVESVAWVAERKDVLGALLWIATMHAYVSWVAEPRARGMALVVGLYALGLLAKPMLVTLPFVLLLVDCWPLRRIGLPWRDLAGLVRCAREKLPLFALAAASSVITYLVARAAGAMTLNDRTSIALRAANAVVAYVTYVWKAIAPFQLAAIYPHPLEAYPAWQVVGGALLLVGATVLALRAASARPWLAVGWLWFVGTLVPVIGLVQVGSAALADRYTYVPMIGLAAAVGFGASEIASRSRPSRIAIAGLFALAVSGWTALTFRQVGFWKDDVTLFRHVADVLPGNHFAHGLLGNVHLRERRFDEAMAEYREAVRLRPSYAEAHSNLGMILEQQGRPDEATAEYQTALRWSPNLAEAHHNLGRMLLEQGRTNEAIPHFEASLRANPGLVAAHVNLGIALMVIGKLDLGIAHFERALEIEPGYPEALTRLEIARAARTRP